MSAQKPPILQTVATAYQDMLRVVNAMPVLTGIIMVILLVANLITLFFLPAPNPNEFTFNDIVLLLMGVVQSFLVTPFLIAVHRFILLGEVTGSYALTPQQPRFLRFFAWSLVLTAMSLVPSVLQTLLGAFGGSEAVVGILSFALMVVFIFLTFRLTILFPAIAVDAPGATAGNAYADTKGSFWRIFVIFVITVLPFMVFALVTYYFGLLSISKNISALGIAGQVVTSIVGVFGYILFVAVASRLFQALADHLNQRG